MLRFMRPSSSPRVLTGSHNTSSLFFTRLWAKAYIARSVIFSQPYRLRDLKCKQLFAKAITLSSACFKLYILIQYIISALTFESQLY
ncbi:hypothetical protein Hanom_Chr07g00610721 [Helianthus anomalus]